MTRSATIERRTGETDVRLVLTLEGSGSGTRETGVGFLDHMLDLLARHGRMDLELKVAGDLQTGAHHTAEDTAIVLGQALDAALGEREGIARYGSPGTRSRHAPPAGLGGLARPRAERDREATALRF